jgi:hypothetical protein
MKWFWAILGVLIAAAIVAALQPPRAARVDPKATADVESLIAEATTPQGASPSSSPPTLATPTLATPPTPSSGTTPAVAASQGAKELVNDLLTPRTTPSSGTPTASAGPVASPTASAESTGEPMRDGLDAKIPNATVKASTLLRRADGTIVADGKWSIRGLGTEADPYVVPWELLVSAMDTYQPRAELREIPQRIAFLDGKRVRVEGYLIFPLVVQQTQQCLVTFNQWDGCCIGVPPSAYDAIEVNLSSSIPVNRKHGLLFAGVEGVLHVEPLLSDGWIYGLYAMDDARLKLEM